MGLRTEMKRRNWASRLAEKFWRLPLRRARMRFGLRRMGRGEVGDESEMAKCLRALAQMPMFVRYVEIGSATGNGSTRQLMSGILSRQDDSALWSVECVRLMHDTAKNNWRGRETGGRLKLIHGSAIRAADMMTPQEAQTHPLCRNSAQVREFVARAYPKNRDAVAAAPNVANELPQKIDVLLLDGGEFSSHAEFIHLRPRARVIVLDDSHRAIKNYRVREQLLNDSEWRLILERPDDRNGWCVFSRVECANDIRAALGELS